MIGCRNVLHVSIETSVWMRETRCSPLNRGKETKEKESCRDYEKEVKGHE